MKRKASVIISILFVVFVIFGGVFVAKLEAFIDWKQIYDDRITEQEQIEFESQLNTKTFYYYNELNNEQQQAYIMLYSMFTDFTDSRRIEVTEEELKELFVAVLYDNSEFFWVDVNYTFVDYGTSIEFSPNYRFDRSTSEKMSDTLDKKIDKIVKGSENLTTDYEKELYFHDCVCDMTVYNEDTFGKMGDTAYSALIDGEAICEGYSRAMQLLLDRVGIRNYLVVGDGVNEEGTEAHMWNIVEIDGENYHLDATWNDTGNENGIGYLYFNVNDNIISRDHINLVPDNNNCVSMNANYFVVNKLYVESFKNYDELVSPVADELRSGDNIVEILFANEEQLSKAMKTLENNNYAFFDFVGDAVRKSGKDLQRDEIEYYTLDEQNYLCLIFKEG